MKLFKDSELYLSRKEWFKVLFACVMITLFIYTIALICSLCGSGYFLCNYHNARLGEIETFFKSHGVYSLLTAFFIVLESYIVACFVSKKILFFTYPLCLYVIIIGIGFLHLKLPSIVYTIIAFTSCLVIPIIDMLITNKKVNKRAYLFCLIRFGIAMITTIIYQLIIYGIKVGNMKFTNGIYNLELTFIYNLEYYIALIITLLFASLFFEGKGDNEKWTTFQAVGGFSQISKKKSQKSNQNNLTPKQQKKIKLLYTRVFLIQTIGFAILMVLPFVLDKVFEFLTLYFSFAIVRVVLGFKYSLHFRKESTCIFVGVVVFSILTLVIPFFEVVVISAICIGITLALLLHFSYRYRGMWLFMQVANKDRYANLFVFFNGNTEYMYVKRMAKHYGVKDETKLSLIADYMSNFKLSYLAKKYNYSQRQINYMLDEIVEIIDSHL